MRLSHSFCRLPLICCLVATACSTGTKVVTTTGKLVSKTATTAITTGGKVAGATVSGGATVAKTFVTTTGSVAGSIAKTAFVTVVDSAAGVARQVPWTEGMKLYAITKSGEANAALKAFISNRAPGFTPFALNQPWFVSTTNCNRWLREGTGFSSKGYAG